MDIKIGEIVSLQHYSNRNPISTLITGIEDNLLTVKLTKDLTSLTCLDGDVMVLGYEYNKHIVTLSCIVHSIKPLDEAMTLRMDYIEINPDERSQERFQVSLYANARTKFLRSSCLANVKNISMGGMMICTKTDLSLDHELEIDLFIEKNTIPFSASIAWKLQDYSGYQYALKTKFKDECNRETLQNYLNTLKTEREEFVKSLKYSGKALAPLF